MTSFMKSATSDLSNIMARGDVQQGRQRASAVASMLNAGDSQVNYSNINLISEKLFELLSLRID